MTLLLVYIGIALTISFLCSILEAVLLSITPSYVARLEQDRPALGGHLRRLKSDVDRPLAAILSLNTVAHTVGAAGAGAQAQLIWGSDVLAAASFVLTLLILVVSEIIPKTLGAMYWRRLAPFTVVALRLLVSPFSPLAPLVILSELITRGLRAKGGTAHDAVSREELAALARLAQAQGVFARSESRILENVLRLGQLRARDIMTPRTVLFSLQADTTVEDVLDLKTTHSFSRIPVYAGSPDEILGYVLKDELLLRAARGERQRRVEELVREILVVPDSTPVPSLFERFLGRREHIALVVDEYGGVDGVVTMEDVVETLLGTEIVDEADTVQDLREMARRRWRERAKRLRSTPPEPLALGEGDEGGGLDAPSE
ncbi:MAG: hemolysin family protein [Myxococcales bacterium]|nr:hemolysin family protein [Myxococcales bacterium]